MGENFGIVIAIIGAVGLLGCVIAFIKVGLNLKQLEKEIDVFKRLDK